MILEQMVQRVIRAGQQVHEEHDGPKTAIQQGLHGHDLGEQDNWIPLCVPEARLHCVVYGIHFVRNVLFRAIIIMDFLDKYKPFLQIAIKTKNT